MDREKAKVEDGPIHSSQQAGDTNRPITPRSFLEVLQREGDREHLFVHVSSSLMAIFYDSGKFSMGCFAARMDINMT